MPKDSKSNRPSRAGFSVEKRKTSSVEKKNKFDDKRKKKSVEMKKREGRNERGRSAHLEKGRNNPDALTRNDRASTEDFGEPKMLSPTEFESDILPLPSRDEQRHLTRAGKYGGKKSTREIFNRAVAKALGYEYESDDRRNIIQSQTVSSVCDTIRMQLYQLDNLSEGEYTFGNLKRTQAAKVLHLRRLLEKKYTFLTMSVAHWAADGFIDEVLRNDRPRPCRKAATRVTHSVASFQTEIVSEQHVPNEQVDRASVDYAEELNVEKEQGEGIVGDEQEDGIIYEEEEDRAHKDSEDGEEVQNQGGTGTFSDEELQELRKQIWEIRRDEDESSFFGNIPSAFRSPVQLHEKRGSKKVTKTKTKKRSRPDAEGFVADEVDHRGQHNKPNKQKNRSRKNKKKRRT